jgi:peptide deformylase
MIYPIYTYGEDILRKKAEDLVFSKFKDGELDALIVDMFETMHNANGAGLAAPQIGVSTNLIVIEEEISDGELFKGVFINPKIFASVGLTTMAEGCLSFPGIYEKITRPEIIDVEWYDENKIHHREILRDIKSRILQHEIDHLNGVLFIDKLHPDNRLKIFMQLEDIKNKKVKTDYPIK